MNGWKFNYLPCKMDLGNINELSAKANADLCGDKTTILVNTFGESVKGRKPGVTKGAQIVLVSDIHQNCPRTYFHQHNAHKSTPESPLRATWK
jgi:hypothetical protein